jgi:hypothetical protein
MYPMASSKANSGVMPWPASCCEMLASHLKPVSVSLKMKPSWAAMAPSILELTVEASMATLQGGAGGRWAGCCVHAGRTCTGLRCACRGQQGACGLAGMWACVCGHVCGLVHCW